MTETPGFDPDWLALREPADMAARNSDIIDELIIALGRRPHARIVDLGAGTGSTLRAICEHLPPWQTWTLVDNDAALLEHGKDLLLQWADTSERTEAVDPFCEPEGLKLAKDDRVLDVRFRVADLQGAHLPVPADGLHLVTSSAFFDLTSRAFAAKLVPQIAKEKAVFYGALEVDGRVAWSPAHPVDGEMKAAFLHDQQIDKGFGPALGPSAPSVLKKEFEAAGYTVSMGPSDWKVGTIGRRSQHERLATALAAGWVDVARENRMVAEQNVDRWSAARQSDNSGCVVGHQDVLAVPT